MKAFKRKLKVLLRDLYWGLRGKAIRNPSVPEDPCSFLFVCKGNICRSPMAGFLAERLLGSDKAENRFGSAGLEVKQTEHPPQEAVQAGKSLGIEMGGHCSQTISAEMVADSDMIFAMEGKQLLELRRRFPEFRQRFFLLPLFEAGRKIKGFQRYNIQDPYGKTVGEFQACYQRIQDCLQNVRVALQYQARFRFGKEEKAEAKVEASPRASGKLTGA